MNLGASRKVVILAVALLACHVLVLALHRALLSNLVELALAAVTAAAAYQTAQRAHGFARRFWRLIAVSFTLYTLGQVFYTYYDSILHASPLIWWPSDALLLFYVAPMIMALFLGDDSAEASAFSSQRRLDFLQVGIVTLSTYLFFFYEPWQSGASPQVAVREVFGHRLGHYQSIQFTLADMEARVHAARLAWYDAAARLAAGERAKKQAAIAKLTASNAAMANARDATQIFGGYGYMNEYPVARFYRDAKGTGDRGGHVRGPADDHRQGTGAVRGRLTLSGRSCSARRADCR